MAWTREQMAERAAKDVESTVAEGRADEGGRGVRSLDGHGRDCTMQRESPLHRGERFAIEAHLLAQWLDALKSITKPVGELNQKKLFYDNAMRVYRLS